MVNLHSWLKQSFWVAGLCLVAALGVKAELVDGIAAVVNEDIITYTDVKNLIGNRIDSLKKMYSSGDPKLLEQIQQTQKEALDELVERRLIIQEFNTKGGHIPETYLEEEIQRIIDEQYGRDRSVFIKTLEAHGLNLEAYKDQIRDKLIVGYMRRSEIGDEIIISPYKIEKFYQDHLKDFKEGEKVKLHIIYVRKGDTEDEIKDNRATATEILLKLTTGSDFGMMASVYSEGAEKKQNGDMGFVDKSTLREELREPAFKLEAGQLSPLIETKDGFYILRVDEKKAATTATLEEARELVERLLVQEEKERLSKRWLQSLRRSAYIKMY
jgi:peptidyl-prolyl cis-trans isomerase SurA